jgi:hypothetical protein
MLYEYKIQKIEDGNKEIKYRVIYAKVGKLRWYQTKKWKEYSSTSFFSSLKDAQKFVKEEMAADRRSEYERKKQDKTVLKEYVYNPIPDHIPEKQAEKFCDLKEVGNERI